MQNLIAFKPDSEDQSIAYVMKAIIEGALRDNLNITDVPVTLVSRRPSEPYISPDWEEIETDLYVRKVEEDETV